MLKYVFSHSEAPNACSGSPPGPTTQGPTTQGPTTQGPTTQGPTTQGPTTQGPTTQPPTNDCVSPNRYQDNWCDDENNIAACNWDGGDCCGPQCLNGVCICRDPDFVGITTTTQGPTTQGPTTQGPTTQGSTTQPPTNDCVSPNWYQDNWCDDENNIAACNWDGGDCCGPQCLNGVCNCRDPDFKGITMGL